MWLWFRLKGNTVGWLRLPLAGLHHHKKLLFTNLHFANALFTSSSPEVGSTSGWKTGISNTKRYSERRTLPLTEAVELVRPTHASCKRNFTTRQSCCLRSKSCLERDTWVLSPFSCQSKFCSEAKGKSLSPTTAEQPPLTWQVLHHSFQPHRHTLLRETNKAEGRGSRGQRWSKAKKSLKGLHSRQSILGNRNHKSY